MAKAERRPGKKGQTHYNRDEQRPAGKYRAGGSGGDKDRPDSGFEARGKKPFGAAGNKPYRKSEEGGNEGTRPFRERKPYRKSEGDEGGSNDRKPYRREGDRPQTFGDRKPYRKEGDRPESSGDRKPYRKDGERQQSTGERKPYRRAEDKPYDKERKPFRRDGDAKPYRKEEDRRTFRREGDETGNALRDGRPAYGSERPEDRTHKPYRKERESSGGDERRGGYDHPKPYGKRAEEGEKRPYRKRDDKPAYERGGRAGQYGQKPGARGFERTEFDEHSNPLKPGRRDTDAKNNEPMTLNKYLAHAGVSSRRDAAGIIKQGKVAVNGKVLAEPGYRVKAGDTVTLDGKVLKPQRHFVYVLLNKPKDFITTTEDDQGRRTVMDLVSGATEDRLYPIGRLDRATTGVLLLTNDGDLAQKLSHPKYENKKIYQVTLDKDLTKRHFDQIIEGVQLEDGMATVDRLAYLDKKTEIGLEIHSGRNRVVRRIFESLGYNVEKLDRVMYAGLTKKNVSRGKWRFLTEQEVVRLKHFRS